MKIGDAIEVVPDGKDWQVGCPMGKIVNYDKAIHGPNESIAEGYVYELTPQALKTIKNRKRRNKPS